MIADLNRLDRGEFVAELGGVWEHSPWVAERAWAERPWADQAGLMEAMEGVVDSASDDEQMDLIRAHPDLAGRLAAAGRLTAESEGEQGGAGLAALTDGERAAFAERNAAYRDRFDFPFIICAREHGKAGILAEFDRRLANGRDAEVRLAISEIKKIARLRVMDRLSG